MRQHKTHPLPAHGSLDVGVEMLIAHRMLQRFGVTTLKVLWCWIVEVPEALVLVQTDDDLRPINPPMIHEVDVLWNPFEDIVPRNTREDREEAAAAKRYCSLLNTKLPHLRDHVLHHR